MLANVSASRSIRSSQLTDELKQIGVAAVTTSGRTRVSTTLRQLQLHHSIIRIHHSRTRRYTLLLSAATRSRHYKFDPEFDRVIDITAHFTVKRSVNLRMASSMPAHRDDGLPHDQVKVQTPTSGRLDQLALLLSLRGRNAAGYEPLDHVYNLTFIVESGRPDGACAGEVKINRSRPRFHCGFRPDSA